MEESMIIGLVFVLGGLVSLGFAAHLFMKGKKIGAVMEGTPGAAMTGMVAVSGRVKAEGPLLKAPITETECVAFDYRIQEERRRRNRSSSRSRSGGRRGGRRRNRGGRNSKRWETVESGCRATRFRLEGPQGSVVVNGGPADVDIKDTKLRRRGRGGGLDMDTGGGGVGGALAGLANSATSRRRRYREKRLDVGETVYVIGEAQQQGDGVEIGQPGEGGVFVVSDRDAKSLARSSYMTAIVLAVVALACVVGGVVLMV